MTSDKPDPIPEPAEAPVGDDWVPRFSFSLKRLLFAFVAYAIALGAYSFTGTEYVAYGLIPGTTMALVVLLFRRKDLGLLFSVGTGALFCAGMGGAALGPSIRVDRVPGNTFTGFVIGAVIGWILGRWLYVQSRPKS